MFAVSLRRADHVREYFVSNRSDAGWEVRSEEDRALRQHACYRDWHRVERTLSLFRSEINELISQGWQVQPADRFTHP
jgi:hypothetical protein